MHEQVFDLMFNLDATEEQLDFFETMYGSSKMGWMSDDWQNPTDTITPLLDKILEVIPEAPSPEGTPQFQVTSLIILLMLEELPSVEYIKESLKKEKSMGLTKADGTVKRVRIKELQTFEGLGRQKVSEVKAGDLCAIVGLEDFEIGDTLTDFEKSCSFTTYRH